DGSITICHVLPGEVPRGLVGRQVVLAPGADHPPPFLRRVLVTLQCSPAQRIQPTQRVVLEWPVAVAVGSGLPVRCIAGPVGMRRQTQGPCLHELGELLAFRRAPIHGAECLTLGDAYVEALRRSDCLNRHVLPPMWETTALRMPSGRTASLRRESTRAAALPSWLERVAPEPSLHRQLDQSDLVAALRKFVSQVDMNRMVRNGRA